MDFKKFYEEQAEWYRKQVEFATKMIESVNKRIKYEKEIYGCETLESIRVKKERSKWYRTRSNDKMKAERYAKKALEW